MKTNSIFSKIFIYFIVFTLILVGTIWISQNFFLPEYYENKKIEIIKSSISTIDETIQKEEFSDNSINIITDISERLNGRITVFDSQGKVLLYEGSQGMMRETRITREEIQKLSEEKFLVYKTNTIRGNNEFLAALAKGENYIYLVLTPFQAIEDAITIAQDFYIFILAGGLLIALLLSYIFANKTSKPLLELNKLAGEIAELDFSGKWNYKRTDEIGQLGNSLNKVSLNLEKSLNDLQNELEKEKTLDKLRKNFVSRVSHELQTPIAIINGHIEALNDGVFQSEEEKEEYLNIIEKETTKMSNLIKDLLDLTQLESGTFKIKKEKINYSELVENKLNSFKILFNEKQINVSKEIFKENIFLNIDSYRLEQVLNNLIQNAINNTYNRGKITLKIAEEGNFIRTEVFNEGKNIPEEILPYIWEPFFKGEEKKGTGIGLAIVRNIINLHEGNAGVENLEDGVMFYYNIPK